MVYVIQYINDNRRLSVIYHKQTIYNIFWLENSNKYLKILSV